MHPHIPAAATAGPAQTVKSYLSRHRGELLGMLAEQGRAGTALANRHSQIIDGLLRTLYPIACATDTAAARALRDTKVVLGAVGGYGRELLGLKSDLDVRLVTATRAESAQALAEALLYPLWDAGVSIGHQVVSVADVVSAAESDLPTATALLDFRRITGDSIASTQLREAAYAGPFSSACVGRFLQRLRDEVSDRHRRFEGSSYLLEPDVKNGPGGLRDLDVALWAARARHRCTDFAALVPVGTLLAHEVEELREATEFLWALRNHLHHHAGRRSDRLTFDEQERVAEAMDYHARVAHEADTQAGRERSIGPMVEAFMSDYHRHTRVVTRLQDQLISRMTPAPARRAGREELIGLGLRNADGELGFTTPASLRTDPALALRLYQTAVARNASVSPAARDEVARITADAGYGTALRASAEAAALFIEIVGTLRPTQFRAGSILAELHDVGLLGALIPEFLRIVGRVHHDAYHVYPVDVHSIAAVDYLRALMRGELGREHPLPSALAGRVGHPEVLLLAALLHDVGKTIGADDHTRASADLTREILQRLGVPPARVAQAERLVAQQARMAFVATRRDLGEPRVVSEFAHQVPNREMLRELYLLTLADLATTAPEALTAWKARMLEELYLASDALLSSLSASATARILAVRQRVAEMWRTDEDARFLHGFLAGMPDRYLLSNSPSEIAAHARVAAAQRAGCTPVTARLVPSRHPEVAELCIVANPPPSTPTTDAAPAPDATSLCVVTGDRPGLLAAITAAIVASRLEIHAAQIHSRVLADGSVQAVDLFWVRDRADGTRGVEQALSKLEHDLARVVAGQVTPDELGRLPAPSRWSERPSPRVATEVTVDSQTSSEHTIIEIITRDRPGLLFKLAKLMHDLGLTIATAKIHTEGNRVIDVFYVSEADGQKLATARGEAVRTQLHAALSPN